VPYSFSSAGQISTEQLRAISMLNDLFARNLTHNLAAWLRTRFQVNLVSAEQIPFNEFLLRIPEISYVASVRLEPLGALSVMQLDLALAPPIIDLLLGGEGRDGPLRELTDIEASVIEGIIVRILGNLREAWATVIDLRPRLGQIETNPQFAQIVPPSEMVVLVTLETKVGEVEGMMNLCIPYMTIEPIVSKLSAQFWYSSVRRGATTENLNILKEKLSSVEIPVIAEVGHISISVRDVLALRRGDVVRLYSVHVDDPMALNVGNKKKFLCRPGVIGKKMAVQITKKLEDVGQEEFEELASEGDENNE